MNFTAVFLISMCFSSSSGLIQIQYINKLLYTYRVLLMVAIILLMLYYCNKMCLWVKAGQVLTDVRPGRRYVWNTLQEQDPFKSLKRLNPIINPVVAGQIGLTNDPAA